MPYFGPSSKLFALLKSPEARAVLDKHLPGLSKVPPEAGLANYTMYRLTKSRFSEDVAKAFISELEQIPY